MRHTFLEPGKPSDSVKRQAKGSSRKRHRFEHRNVRFHSPAAVKVTVYIHQRKIMTLSSQIPAFFFFPICTCIFAFLFYPISTLKVYRTCSEGTQLRFRYSLFENHSFSLNHKITLIPSQRISERLTTASSSCQETRTHSFIHFSNHSPKISELLTHCRQQLLRNTMSASVATMDIKWWQNPLNHSFIHSSTHSPRMSELLTHCRQQLLGNTMSASLATMDMGSSSTAPNDTASVSVQIQILAAKAYNYLQILLCLIFGFGL